MSLIKVAVLATALVMSRGVRRIKIAERTATAKRQEVATAILAVKGMLAAGDAAKETDECDVMNPVRDKHTQCQRDAEGDAKQTACACTFCQELQVVIKENVGTCFTAKDVEQNVWILEQEQQRLGCSPIAWMIGEPGDNCDKKCGSSGRVCHDDLFPPQTASSITVIAQLAGVTCASTAEKCHKGEVPLWSAKGSSTCQYCEEDRPKCSNRYRNRTRFCPCVLSETDEQGTDEQGV